MRNSGANPRTAYHLHDYSHEMLQECIQKSEILRISGDSELMIEKSIQSIQQESEPVHQHTTEEPYSDSEYQCMQDQTYSVAVTNIPEQNPCACSIPATSSEIMNVILGPNSQMMIRDIRGLTQYSFNFDTVDVNYGEEEEDESFILKVTHKIELKFSRGGSRLGIGDFWSFREKVRAMIEGSFGKKYGMRRIVSKHEMFYQVFHRQCELKFKSAIDFLQNCETGDILLFQGSNFFSKVQRFLTNSSYDHVGIVIRDPKQGILIFESNSQSGVCLLPFELILRQRSYRRIPRIAWRRLLDVDRNEAFIRILHDFVQKNNGKKYYLSISKLACNTSYLPPSKAKDGFCCSELAASLYKDLYLLTRDREDPNYMPHNQFYPFHFTQKFQLPLKRGRLSEEYILDFDQKHLGDYLLMKGN